MSESKTNLHLISQGAAILSGTSDERLRLVRHLESGHVNKVLVRTLESLARKELGFRELGGKGRLSKCYRKPIERSSDDSIDGFSDQIRRSSSGILRTVLDEQGNAQQ